jgi:hypothetical protein
MNQAAKVHTRPVWAHPLHLADRARRRATEICLSWTFPCEDWSLTSLKEKLIKIGAKVVSHGRYVAFQVAEVAIARNLFADILRLIAELRPSPLTSTA